jgi:hypothetical protein
MYQYHVARMLSINETVDNALKLYGKLILIDWREEKEQRRTRRDCRT